MTEVKQVHIFEEDVFLFDKSFIHDGPERCVLLQHALFKMVLCLFC
jgi:hypothetical protein